jgi:ABC-type sugar transport system ATPase subunit
MGFLGIGYDGIYTNTAHCYKSYKRGVYLVVQRTHKFPRVPSIKRLFLKKKTKLNKIIIYKKAPQKNFQSKKKKLMKDLHFWKCAGEE